MTYEENDDDVTESRAAPAPPYDRFGDALALIAAATSPKETRKKLLHLRRLERDIAAAEQKLAAVSAKAEQTAAALADRESAIAAREVALDARETEFASQAGDVRDELRGYYDQIAEADRHIRYRILASADLLSGYNLQLQDLPDWPQIRRLVAGLPDDPPAIEREVATHPRIDAFSDVSDDPRADRHGNTFLGSLTRSTEHKRGAA